MALGKRICLTCKTGKESYELDRHSETCPYIRCWKNWECSYYVPLESPEKEDCSEKSNTKPQKV